jgi:CubicO group peptidase (beta-lactamase class C family)
MAGNTITIDDKRLGAILHKLKGDSCAFYAERVENGITSFQAGAIKVSSDGRTFGIPVETLFAYASLQKPLFLNIALSKIIDEGMLEDARKRRIMKGSWGRGALKVLNELRKADNLDPLQEPKGHSTTILQLLAHIHAFTSSQQHLIGPEGSFLMCEDTFVQILGRLTDAEERDYVSNYHYSNWNYIVAALIIKHATALSLSEALKKLVLDPFELTNTIVDEAAFDLKQDAIARPFVTTPDATSQEVPIRHYLRDDLELAVGGGYSCVEDIAKLLRFLMEAYTKDNKLVEERFFQSNVVLKGEDSGSQSFLSGLRVSLDSEAAGSESVERALFGNYYKLSMRRGQSVDVIMKAGTVKGYSCRYYIVPKGRLFVVILTNSSGLVDPSLHIGQDILQHLLELDDPKDIGSKVSGILTKQCAIAQFCTAGLLPPLRFSAREINGLEAVYIDEKSLRQVDIRRSGTDALDVKIEDCRSTGRNSTTRMRLLKVADDVLSVAPHATEAAVDFYTIWRDFALEMKWDGGDVRFLHQISASSVTDVKNVPEKGYKAKFTRNFQ